MDILILILKCAISFTDADFVKVFDNRIEEPEIRMYTLTKGGFMIRYVDGDFFDYAADIRINTVNCVGVMGAGVAFAFLRISFLKCIMNTYCCVKKEKYLREDQLFGKVMIRMVRK